MRAYYSGMSEEVRIAVISKLRADGIRYGKLWDDQILRDSDPAKLPINSRRLPQDFFNSLFIFDFCRIWTLNLTILGLDSIMSKEPNNNLTLYQIRSISLLLARLHIDLRAVRLLVLRGMDVQARQITRSVSETIDAIGLACLDSEFCETFARNHDIEESSAVWFKYVSKGKARKLVYRAVEEVLGPGTLNDQRDYRAQEETAFSAASHPSYLSGFVSILPHFGEGNEEAGDYDVSKNSIRTIGYCASRMLELMSYDMVALHCTEGFSSNVSGQAEDIQTKKIKDIAFKLRSLAPALTLVLYGYDAANNLQPRGT